MKTETDSSPKLPTVDVGSLARGSAFYDNVPHPPLSERAIETAAIIETRSSDEGENYRRWVAIQIDEARRDAFIDCQTEMEKLRDALSACAEETDLRNVRGIVKRVLSP